MAKVVAMAVGTVIGMESMESEKSLGAPVDCQSIF